MNFTAWHQGLAYIVWPSRRAWETEVVPETWKTISKSTDEVWAPSQYVADSLRRALDVPVHPIHMGFGIKVPFERSILAPTGSQRSLLYSSSSSI